jgi:superfamily II DNA helicase RecQ
VVVATKAFEAGVDYPHVRAIIHVGAPKNCLAYSQQVGRGGRDGRSAVYATILPHSWSPAY